jgi:hypothetical protein
LRAAGLSLAGAVTLPGLAAGGAAEIGRRAGPTDAGAGGRLRGIMADAARLPEPLSYYRRLLDFGREWGLNALVLRLTDDQGSALRFRSHPELVTHRHALTPDEARDLAAHGDRQGVMVIPEVESFGHTRYITSVPRHAHLEDRRGGDGFTGLCPVASETLALIGDLYREVAAIFSAPYLHGGCDEVNWGGSELSQRALQTKSRAQIWAEYVNALNEVCRPLGKELIVWGDAILHRDPDILPRLDRRVIVMDWQYQALDPRPLARAALQVAADGRRVLGAPALISCAWGPRPGERQLRNVDAFVEAYAGIRDPRCLGIVVTNWVPTRYVQGSLWDSFAYAGVALTHGREVARHSGFRSFVERFYGAEWNRTWESIVETCYRIAPSRRACAPAWPGDRLIVPWATERDLLRALRAAQRWPSPYAAVRESLNAVESGVRRHPDDFSAFTLSVEYLDHVLWRQAVLGEAATATGRSSIARVVENVAARDRRLTERLDADWATGRFRDAPGKLDALPGLEPADQLHYTMGRAAAFSAELAGDTRRLQRLVDTARPGRGPTR